jgi:hypothetical protein
VDLAAESRCQTSRFRCGATGALDSSANRDGLRNTIEGEVEMDMKEIGSGFCDAALNAFGSSGQAIQNLLYKNG